jgi:hypothetical protein
MFNTIVGAGAASRYGSSSGSDQMMSLLAAPAPQHWFGPIIVMISMIESVVNIKRRSMKLKHFVTSSKIYPCST